VTIVEMAERLIAREDAEVSAAVKEIPRSRGHHDPAQGGMRRPPP
jgi:hypothetical protein